MMNAPRVLNCAAYPPASLTPNYDLAGPALQTSHLTVCYHTITALRDVTVMVQPGRLTGVIGPNGAGKSTFMQALLGLIPVAQGTVRYGDRPLSAQRSRVAYVPQRSQIDPAYPATVGEVAMMGRARATGWLRRYSAASRGQVAAALARVGLWELRDRPISELSGGQRQRVFLARSLAQNADIFCFDEPFAGVDRKTEAILFEVFHELADLGKIVLVVNHDLGESITHFDDLILLRGEVIAHGERRWVLTDRNLQRAYGGRVSFYNESPAPMGEDVA